MYAQFTSCVYGDTTLNYSINKDVVVFTYFSFSID